MVQKHVIVDSSNGSKANLEETDKNFSKVKENKLKQKKVGLFLNLNLALYFEKNEKSTH